MLDELEIRRIVVETMESVAYTDYMLESPSTGYTGEIAECESTHKRLWPNSRDRACFTTGKSVPKCNRALRCWPIESPSLTESRLRNLLLSVIAEINYYRQNPGK